MSCYLKRLALIGAVILTFAGGANAASESRHIRFTALKADDLTSLINTVMDSGLNDVIEFRRGDRVPVTFKAEGDLVQSLPGGETTLEVKRDFFLKADGRRILISWDDQEFKPFEDVVSGQLSVTATATPGLAILLTATAHQD